MSQLIAPTQIPGLALWLDASDTSTITQSGGAVSQWNDKSGLGRNLTQGTGAKQPITGTRTINGKNTLDFDGSAMSMSGPSSLYSIPAAANTAFFVFANDLTTGTSQELVEIAASGSRRYIAALNPGTPSFSFVNRSGSAVGGTVSYAPNLNAHIAGFNYDGASTVTGFWDGAPTGSGGSQSAFTGTEFVIGSFQGTGSFFNGRYAEIIMYTRALSSAEKNLIGKYLANKWGFTWTNLP